MNIHESAEDYLEKILMLQEQKGSVRSIDIAVAMGYSKPSGAAAAGAVLKPLGGNCAVLPYAYSPYNTAQRASTSRAGRAAAMARAASSFSSVVKSPSSGKCCKIFCSRSS